jgi:hypothetical protein
LLAWAAGSLQPAKPINKQQVLGISGHLRLPQAAFKTRSSAMGLADQFGGRRFPCRILEWIISDSKRRWNRKRVPIS